MTLGIGAAVVAAHPFDEAIEVHRLGGRTAAGPKRSAARASNLLGERLGCPVIAVQTRS